MKSTLLESVSEIPDAAQQKKQIMADIKSLQRDLIRTSFKQSSAPGAYGELLKAIHDKRAELKQLNQ